MVALEQDEYIIKEVRKHWFFIVYEIVFNTAAILLPFIIIVAVSIFGYGNQRLTEITSTLFILYPLWILAIWISFFYFWTDYYLDVLIVTNKRIIDIDQRGMFHREISTFPLENIQDITIDIPGIIATFLDFGNVRLQTASERVEFVIDNAAKPELVKQVIQDAHDKVLGTMKNVSV